MIWSVTKIIVFLCLVAAVAFGASFVIETGGEVRIAFAGQEFSMTPLIAIICLALLVASVWAVFFIFGLLMAVFRFFNGDETAISRYFDQNREQRGYKALSEGLVSLAAGESKAALANAAKAERYLNKPELTNLISAQAAEMAGDTTKATKYYKQLLADDQTRFVGIRGLMKQKLENGDQKTAMALANKALALRPKHESTIDTLFALQSETGDWVGAQKTIQSKLATGGITRDVARRRNAVLALADAKALMDAGDVEAGAKRVAEANGLAPALVPAAVLASESETNKGNKRTAAKIIKKAWSAAPHPDLAAAFAEIEPDETAAARLKRFSPLIKSNVDASESKLLHAELQLAAEDFPAARRALGALPEEHPTARSLTIMAAIARGEGADDPIIRGWLNKAMNASRGSQWICTGCSHIHGQWSPTCDNCGAFDTLDWTAPPENDDLSSVTHMLPVMAGVLEAEPDVLVAEDAASDTEEEIKHP